MRSHIFSTGRHDEFSFVRLSLAYKPHLVDRVFAGKSGLLSPSPTTLCQGRSPVIRHFLSLDRQAILLQVTTLVLQSWQQHRAEYCNCLMTDVLCGMCCSTCLMEASYVRKLAASTAQLLCPWANRYMHSHVPSSNGAKPASALGNDPIDLSFLWRLRPLETDQVTRFIWSS